MNNKNSNTIISLALLAVVITILLTACGSGSTPSQGAGQVLSSTPAQDSVQGNGSISGQTLMDERCSVCHSTSRITSAQKTLDEWTTTVDRMINKGAQLSADEKQILIDYLAANFK